MAAAHRDIVSKMARKYSQYRLPSANELDCIDSEEENDAQRSPDDAHYPLHEHRSTDDNDNADDDDDNKAEVEHPHNDEDEDEEEEDEDILSETNTMLSHHSHHSRMLSKSSAGNRSLRKVQFSGKSKANKVAHFNPEEEIHEMHADRAFFMEIFDKYFDEDNQEDVDLQEFKKGLKKLGIPMSDEQMDKLFGVLLMNADDTENDGYLDREQFGDFLTRRFEAPQLVAQQELLLQIIEQKAKKNETRKTLMDAQDAEKWDAAEVSLAEMEMRQAMEQMVDHEMVKLNKEQEFHEELERRMADPQFCEESNAENWDCYEVACWVGNKQGYQSAQKRFFDQQIDGNVLLYDINENQLLTQLGITQLHTNKFMRSLNELRQRIFAQKRKSGPLVMEFNVSPVGIQSHSAEKEQMIMDLRHKHEAEIQEYKLKVLEAESQSKLHSTQTAEDKLEMQRERNQLEEKYIASQREIVDLKGKLNEKQEELNNIKNVHILKMNDLAREHELQLKEMENKMIDYNSRKADYDSICAQLNESKQQLSSLKLQLENVKQSNQLAVESMKRQFDRENEALSEQIKKLTTMNDNLSDENKTLKQQQQKQHAQRLQPSTPIPPRASTTSKGSASPYAVVNENKIGPLYEQHHEESNNPYLDLSSPKLSGGLVAAAPFTPSSSSYSLQNYVKELEEKADGERFANPAEANKWTVQEVAYWLTTIGMKKYIAQFIDDFIDGQSLLNDINAKNLVSDLDVKSLHAPKIIRELNKLKQVSTRSRRSSISSALQLSLIENVTNFQLDSFENVVLQELRTQSDTLKSDLSETRMRLRHLQTQLDEHKAMLRKQRQSSMNGLGNLPNLSPTSSTYSIANPHNGGGGGGGYQSDATTLTAKSNPHGHHLRTESNFTQRTALSEGDMVVGTMDPHALNGQQRESTPPVPQEPLSPNWQKYVGYLERKNRDLRDQYLRADMRIQKYVKNIGPLTERIGQLESNNERRRKQLDKVNRRLARRSETVAKLQAYVKQLEQIIQQSGGMRGSNNSPDSENSSLSILQPLALTPMSSTMSTVSSDYENLPTTTGPIMRSPNSPANKATVMTPDMERLLKQQQSTFESQNYPQLQHPNQYDVHYQQYSIPRSHAMQHSSSHPHQSHHHHQNSYGRSAAHPHAMKKHAQSSSMIFREKKHPRKSKQGRNKHRMILGNDYESGKPQITGYMSTGSTASIQSAPAHHINNDGNNGNTSDSGGGVVASIGGMLYGYLMGGSGTTPGGTY